MAVFYDTHAHLVYSDFASDLGAVIERASAAGIEKIVSIGTDLESSRRALGLAETYPNIYAAVGWHPSDVMQAPADGLIVTANNAITDPVAGWPFLGREVDPGYRAQRAPRPC